MRKKVTVLEIPVDNVTMKEAVSCCEGFIEQGSSHMIATANAEMIMMAQQDQELASILRQADLVVPDWAGVVWAARYRGDHIVERVAGYDLSQRLLALSAEKGYKVFFFGGAPGIAEKAKARSEEVYKGIRFVGVRDGYFSQKEEFNIIKQIIDAQPDILFVALGVPKQEKWIIKHKEVLNVPIAIGVGGTFDVMAGTVKRAPLWMQQANLEWLYRLLSQPQRALRMLALPRFVLQVMTSKSIRQK